MKKATLFFIPLMTVLLFAIGMQTAAFAADDAKEVKIFDQGVSKDAAAGLVVSGKIPRVSGLKTAGFQRDLNDAINKAKDDAISAAEDNAQEIYFSYQKRYNGDIVSLLMKVTVTNASAENKVTSFNFDASAEKLVELNDPKVLGVNGVKLANKAVSARILSQPEKYNATFAGISETQDFYIEKDVVTVLFDDFEIAPGYQGIQEIPIPLRSVRTMTLGKNDYITQDENYGLNMIPLRQVIEDAPFYYKLNWDAAAKDIRITKDGQTVSRIAIGRNQYTKGQSLPRALEAAPQIWEEKDRTVVPISFFEEILDISFSVDDAGKITFSQYMP